MRVAERVLGIVADRGSGRPGGRYAYGSGFLVAGRAVLTCAHVVAGARTVLLDDAVGNRYTGQVRWRGDPRAPGAGTAPDLAIVEIDDPALDAPPFPVAEIDRGGMGALESVRVVGWPRFMDGPVGARRSTYSAVGSIDVMSRLRDGLLRIDVGGSPPATTGPGSPWQGFSGAPVLVDGHLAAVVTTHGLSEGPGALIAIPLTALDGAAEADQWWSALGVTRSASLSVVRPGPAGPPCVVHHQTILRSLEGYRSSLLYDVMPYVEPPSTTAWHPRNIWRRLRAGDGANSVLVSGHGGVGKTRTLLEVAGLAVEDDWTVLHVRPGNAAAVVDHVAAVVRSSFTPVLLVVDYLNQSMAKDLDLAQLLALVQQSRRGASPRLAVVASARTGWLLTAAHARDVVALEQIRLEPEGEDLKAICASLAQAAAPRAAKTLGPETLLAYTGAIRPILTLLVARQIEDRIKRDLPPLPRASMDASDLQQWLDIRLDEDQLVPRLDTPDSLWGPQVKVHIQAAAAVFLATPADEPALLEAATHLFGDRASAANLLRLLTEMGWLTKVDDVLESVHDVVTDFLVAGVMFWSTTHALRPAITAQLLDAVSGRPGSLEHALVALSRLVDDLDEQQHAAVVAETDRWFAQRREQVAQLLLQDPGAGARTAAVLLSSGMLTTTRQEYWKHLFSPLLAALGHRHEAYTLLLAAARSLPPQRRDTAAELADYALAWLTGRPLGGVSQLMRILVRRDDLPPEQGRAAVQLGLNWLQFHARDAQSDFLLSAILWCDVVDHDGDPDLERLVDFALEWLAENGTQLGASYLLQALSKVKNLPAHAIDPLVTFARAWLRPHGQSVDASYVLPGLLSDSGVPEDRSSGLIGFARRWIASHSTMPEANYVLAHLLGRRDLTHATLTETLGHVREWLEENSDSATADYLIRRALAQPAMSADMVAVVRAAAQDWLSRYGTTETANYLLQALVQDSGLPEELRTATHGTAEAWLGVHGEHLGANFLLQVLLKAKDLPESLRTATFSTARAWLQIHGEHLGASFLLQVLLKAKDAPEDLRTTTYATVETWLQTHDKHPDARYLIEVLLQTEGLPADLRATALTAARTSLRTHGADVGSAFLLQILFRLADLPDDLRTTTHTTALTTLRTHGKHLGTNYLLQVLLRQADDLPEELRATTYSTAQTWLQTHDKHPDARYLIEILLRADGLPAELRTTTFTAALTSLRAHPDDPGTNFLLQVLLKAKDPPEDLRTATYSTAQTWLRRYGEHPDARFLIEVLLRVTGLPADLRTTTYSAAETSLRIHGKLPDSRFLIQALLQAHELPAALRTAAFTTAQTWLHDHGKLPDTRYLIDALLQIARRPSALRQAAVNAVMSWLDAWWQEATAGAALRAVLQDGPDEGSWDLTDDQRLRLTERALQWLSHFESTTEARQVIVLMLQPHVSDARTRRRVLRAAVGWLDEYAGTPRASEIISDVLGSQDLPDDLLPRAFKAAELWLSREKLHAYGARFVLQALFHRQSAQPDLVRDVLAGHLRVIEQRISAPKSRFTLGVIVGEPALDPDIRQTVMRLARTWLATFAEVTNAHLVIASVARRDDLTGDEVRWLEDATRAWLGSNADGPAAAPLAQTLLESGVPFTAELKGTLWTIRADSDPTDPTPA
ncbi:S1 family peptidase [Phytohabitans houttuyneae]|uniref:Trypsin-like peptidase domain-containing protein n=1 Tax=Phytohabitans houttuyneae TaxID=1076126 RepID=A0A6V8KD01_9ACTN|nr:serine protease [Phytohabitans houttuyneae]GFJ81330.1 hypothetical protein Phou_055100 [Phytohabitans houttuyneae]